MKRLVLTVFVVLTVCLTSTAQKSKLNIKYKSLIDSLFIVDQQVQQDFIEVLLHHSSTDSIKLFEERKEQTFIRHTPILKDIYKKIGYPTFKKVGKETSSKFFTLIQHCDKDVSFQSQMLVIIKKQVAKKQVQGSDYAFLYDRVQLNSGKQQLYGTQVDYDQNNNAFPKNLKDNENVNKNRAALGMDTLESYLKMVTEMHKRQNGIN